MPDDAPQLRFPESELPRYANRYSYALEDTIPPLVPEVRRRGCMTKDDLRVVAKWKAPRAAGKMEANGDDYVQETTTFAFGAATERARIESLTLLSGVSWPMASVILHFFHAAPYPILDYRALWSVSLAQPAAYGFEFWWKYAVHCRELAARNSLGMRALDRALWQYSKEHQPGKSEKPCDAFDIEKMFA